MISLEIEKWLYIGSVKRIILVQWYPRRPHWRLIDESDEQGQRGRAENRIPDELARPATGADRRRLEQSILVQLMENLYSRVNHVCN